MGRHEAAPATYDAIVSDYVTQRARELIRQADDKAFDYGPLSMAEWIGAAAEILRELSRDA